MKIAIISDIHGNLAYLKKAKEIIDQENIEVIICCGDVQGQETLLELDSWKEKVYLAWGNGDFALINMIENGFIEVSRIKTYEEFGEITLAGKKIAFTHFDYIARKLAAKEKYDIVFYGHRHTPWLQQVGSTLTLNPGEIAAQYGKPTFAIFDIDEMKAELKILN